MGNSSAIGGSLGIKSLAHFSKQAATSMKLGLPLSRAFPIIARESRDRRLRRTLEEINADIAGGSKLTEAFRARGNKFPSIFLEMVDAGERSGHLESTFLQLTDYFDSALKFRRAVIRSSIYPIIQLTVAYAVFCILAIVFSRDRYAIAQVIAYSTLGVLFGLGLVSLFLSRTALGRAILDRLVLVLPLLRPLTLKLCMARFSRTLAIQLDSAIPLAESVERAALASGNGAVAENFLSMAESIRQGASLGKAVQELQLVTPLVREALALGEEMGNFTEAFERVAETYEDEAMFMMESIPKFIGPVIIIIVGIITLYLALSILGVIQDGMA